MAIKIKFSMVIDMKEEWKEWIKNATTNALFIEISWVDEVFNNAMHLMSFEGIKALLEYKNELKAELRIRKTQ